MKKSNKIWMALLPVLLTACGGMDVKETLGIGAKAPDEFRVVARPPLSMPPDFDLRPPSDGDETIAGTPASDQAKNLVMGSGPEGTTVSVESAMPSTASADTAVKPVSANPLDSNADAQFLQNAGAGAAKQDIRDAIRQDNQTVVRKQEEASEGWFGSIWSPSKPKEPVVDAAGEADRIKENKSEGKPVTEGDTPLKKGKDRGILDNILTH